LRFENEDDDEDGDDFRGSCSWATARPEA
jgi:hypothetical protein